MKNRLPLLIAALVGLLPFLALAPSAQAAGNNLPKKPTARDKAAPLEFPLILRAERAALFEKSPRLREFSASFGERFYYHLVVLSGLHISYRRYERYDFEPFGFHVDANPFNGPEPLYAILPEPGKLKLRPTKPATGPFAEAGIGLALFSRKNVLVSARIENRVVKGPAWPERVWDEHDFIRNAIEPNGGKVVALGDDTYVLLEAPGHELAFVLGSFRPRQYEQEREAWLVEHPYYSAQGLIYQPTAEFTSELPELSAKDPKIRHAAAALAKLTRKELFVQAGVEKRDFQFPSWRPDVSPEENWLRIERQLEQAEVQIVELDANSLALVELVTQK